MSQEDRHMCHCGKGFLRKEHLRRHQATHAQPAFVCHICDRSFTRNDVLRRHIAVHDSAQVPTTRTWRACDACHENKTKCDGGEQCALCSKRGIDCTYTRDGSAAEVESDGKGGVSEKGVSDPAADSAMTMAIDDVDVESTSREEERETSQPKDSPQINVHLARAGLECVSNAVAAAMAGKKHQTPPKETQPWVSQSTQAYFGAFHERWPIVHAPVFDEKTDGTLLVATVVMIGSWHSDDASVRHHVLKLHERFMFYLLRKMIAEDDGSDKPWPYETYQIILLQVVFAFESGKRALWPGARRLLCLLINALRSNGSLNPDIIEAHESTHSLGTFRPWVWGHRARWRRLAFLTFRIDTYFGLSYNQPPLLQPEELELSMYPTFSIENAHGIHKFIERDAEKPPWRAQVSMSAVIRGSSLPSGLLIEDVVLGLCGTYREVWKYSRHATGSTLENSTHSNDGVAVVRQVETWKTRLDDISNLWTEPQSNAQAINSLLRAYRGDEDVGSPGWESPALTRIAIYSRNATFLYHLISLHAAADVRSLDILTLGAKSLGDGLLSKPLPSKRPTLEQWAIGPQARCAVMHSIFMLKAYENSLANTQESHQTMDPIAQVALCTGAIVLRGWFAGSSCQCHGGGLQSLDVDNAADKECWIQLNGSVSVDNVALCRCSFGPWMARFAAALTKGAELWDMSGSVVECLRRPLDA